MDLRRRRSFPGKSGEHCRHALGVMSVGPKGSCPNLRMLFPGTAGVSPALSAKREKPSDAGETPAVPGKSMFTT